MTPGWTNQLYFGDNLTVTREHLAPESVDLIYLDPPFNSQASYNVLFQEQGGESSSAQITAFEDTWHWSQESEATFQELVTQGPAKAAELMKALRSFLGTNDMMAYLTMMAVRLVELHRVLKPTGSLYLHCDPTASHYLKITLDAVFGKENFRNEISWKRSQPKSQTKVNFSKCRDVILRYSKTEELIFNKIFALHDAEYLNKFYKNVDSEGRRYQLADLTNPNPNRPNLTYEFLGVTRVWRWTKRKMMKAHQEGLIVQPRPGAVPRLKRYLDEMPGQPVTDDWNDVEHLHGSHAERLGYPTQKPEALLERIILASSNEGDVVLDPFCGCGTTIAVAERLHRRWIGIDITHIAITLMRHRLHDAFSTELTPFRIFGLPKDLASARALARENRYQFEYWALGQVDARPAQDKKKGADSGIDGVINFFDDPSGNAKKLIIQVKSGKVQVSQIRDLKGVLEREKAAVAAFITLEEPTAPMLREAAAAGFYQPEFLPDMKYPRLQVLTVEDLFKGRQLAYPILGTATFKKAQRQSKIKQVQGDLW